MVLDYPALGGGGLGISMVMGNVRSPDEEGEGAVPVTTRRGTMAMAFSPSLMVQGGIEVAATWSGPPEQGGMVYPLGLVL